MGSEDWLKGRLANGQFRVGHCVLQPDKEAAIVAAIKSGRPAWQIRSECRTCCRTVRKVAERHGLTIQRGTRLNIERLRQCYLLDVEHGSAKAGEMLGMHRASVSKAARRYLTQVQEVR